MAAPGENLKINADRLWDSLIDDMAPPWDVTWDASALPYGDYRLRCIATDATGNTDGAPASIIVIHSAIVGQLKVMDAVAVSTKNRRRRSSDPPHPSVRWLVPVDRNWAGRYPLVPWSSTPSNPAS